MKTSNKLALVAVPALLAAAALSVTGAFAKNPSATRLAAAPAANVQTIAAKAPASTAASNRAESKSDESATEPRGEATTEPANEPANAAGTDVGHADNPNDPNADHQFDGQE